MRASLYLFFCLSLVSSGSGADLQARIDQLISDSPALNGAFVGIKVVDLSDGRVVYERNSDRLFVPASNTKLFTSALALTRLGAQYKFTTEIVADQPIAASGTLESDLIFVGGGDPSLSARPYPYQYTADVPAAANFSFRAIEDLADRLVERGLKRVDGNIVGDDRHYLWEPHPEVWQEGDGTHESGAPVSAFVIDDNTFALTLRPSAKAGDLAEISLTPAFEYFSIDNRVRTEMGAQRKLEVERPVNSRELRLRGVLPTGAAGSTQLLAVDDPALYAAMVLRTALQQRGVSIHGQAVARHRFADEMDDAPASASTPQVVLAERASPTLDELLRVTAKVSQNLHAEVMLREVGSQNRPAGSRQTGLGEMQTFLENTAGVSKGSYILTDGSGMSRSNLVTPSAVVQLLTHMYRSAHRDLWISLLPVAGADGTLANRFEKRPEANSIHAKTGTLGHVRALSGYALAPDRDPLVFSLLVNNFNAPASEIVPALDQIALALLN